LKPNGEPVTDHPVVVDPDGAGAQAARQAVRATDVLRPDAGGQAVRRVIGDPDRLLVRKRIRQTTGRRSLACQSARVVDVAEDGRLDENPVGRAAASSFNLAPAEPT
jgi:hypothetical protein